MKTLIRSNLLVLILFCQPIYGQKIESAIQRFLNHPDLRHASIGISVVDMDNYPLVSHNGLLNLIPASTLKILTTMSALEYLGDGYHFTTDVGLAGTLTDYKSFHGDLIINASGDPSLCSEYIEGPDLVELCQNIYSALIKKNIECIEGDLVIHLQKPVRPAIHDTWQWQDIGNYYAGGSHSFNIIDNSYALQFNTLGSNGDPCQLVSVDPSSISLTFINQVRIGPAHSGDQSYIYGSPYDKIRTIKGTLPRQKAEFTIKGSLPNPDLFFGQYLKSYLEERGLNIGKVRTAPSNEQLLYDTLLSMDSPPLSHLVKITNEESINLYAEALLNEVLRQSQAQSISLLYQSFFKSLGINDQHANIKDGSGLSARNRINAKLLTTLLHKSIDQSWHHVFVKSLAIGGEEGTLDHTFDYDSDLKVIAKSGSMGGVKAYAGYIIKNKDARYPFAILVNEYQMTGGQLKKRIEKLILDIMNI